VSVEDGPRNLLGSKHVYEFDMADMGWFSETKSGSCSRVTRNKALATLTPMVTHGTARHLRSTEAQSVSGLRLPGIGRTKTYQPQVTGVRSG